MSKPKKKRQHSKHRKVFGTNKYPQKERKCSVCRYIWKDFESYSCPKCKNKYIIGY